MKVRELQKRLEKRKIDAAIFYNMNPVKEDPNLVYFEDYAGFGFLVVPKRKRPFLIIPRTDRGYAKKTRAKVFFWKSQPVSDIIKNQLGCVKVIGVDEKNFSIYIQKQLRKKFKGARFKDISDIFLGLREVKAKKEIAIYRKACRLTDNILQKCIANFKKFRKEDDVSVFLKKEALDNNLEMSFEPIVASGPNASSSHSKPSGKLKKGFCIIDFGIKYKGYCTDMTRTIYLGKPSKKERGIYTVVLNSQLEAIKMLKPGIKAVDVYNKAKKELGSLQKYFLHGLGHGVGTEIHEKPNLSFKSKDIIKKNSIFTVEPGVYVKNKFGIRVEDDILMLDKPIVLTKTSKKLKCIR